MGAVPGRDNITEPNATPIRLVSPYAGFVSRAIALVTDLVILALLMAVSTYLGGLLIQTFGFTLITERLIRYGVIAFNTALPVVYFTAFVFLAGQTPGKAFMGIEIVSMDGKELTVARAALRWLGYLPSSFLLLGFLWVLVDPRRQTFHDKLAGTLVLYVPRQDLPTAADEPAQPDYDR